MTKKMSKSDSSHSSQAYKRFSSIGNWNKKKIIQKSDIICFTNGKKHGDSVRNPESLDSLPHY